MRLTRVDVLMPFDTDRDTFLGGRLGSSRFGGCKSGGDSLCCIGKMGAKNLIPNQGNLNVQIIAGANSGSGAG